VGLPGSTFSARGQVSWPGGPILFDLAMRADSATLTDIRFVDPRFPEGAVLHGDVALRSHSSQLLEIRLEPIDVRYAGGRVTGRVTAFSASDSGLVALRRGDLNSQDLSLELVRPYLDTLPFAGWLTGRTVVDGPMGALQMRIFEDRLVEITASQVGVFQMSALQIGASQVALPQVGVVQAGFSEVGALQMGAAQTGGMQARALHVGLLQLGRPQVGFVQVRALQPRPAQVRVPQHRASQVRPGQINRRQAGLRQIRV